jgi:ribosomal protein S27AE
MTVERAIEILDPEHREHYDSIEVVEEACRMGMDALRTRGSMKVVVDERIGRYVCPSCGKADFLENDHDTLNNFCGCCGQALNWSEFWYEWE